MLTRKPSAPAEPLLDSTVSSIVLSASCPRGTLDCTIYLCFKGVESLSLSLSLSLEVRSHELHKRVPEPLSSGEDKQSDSEYCGVHWLVISATARGYRYLEVNPIVQWLQ